MATKLGMIKRVSMVETNNPNNITFANGAHVSEVPPNPNAIGTRPEMVVNDVKMIGRKRNLPASTILLQYRCTFI